MNITNTRLIIENLLFIHQIFAFFVFEGIRVLHMNCISNQFIKQWNNMVWFLPIIFLIVNIIQNWTEMLIDWGLINNERS